MGEKIKVVIIVHYPYFRDRDIDILKRCGAMYVGLQLDWRSNFLGRSKSEGM